MSFLHLCFLLTEWWSPVRISIWVNLLTLHFLRSISHNCSWHHLIITIVIHSIIVFIIPVQAYASIALSCSTSPFSASFILWDAAFSKSRILIDEQSKLISGIVFIEVIIRNEFSLSFGILLSFAFFFLIVIVKWLLLWRVVESYSVKVLFINVESLKFGRVTFMEWFWGWHWVFEFFKGLYLVVLLNQPGLMFSAWWLLFQLIQSQLIHFGFGFHFLFFPLAECGYVWVAIFYLLIEFL